MQACKHFGDHKADVIDRCRTFYVSYEFGSEREREIGEGEREGYLLFESGNSNQ
jgi:hypothetical protein